MNPNQYYACGPWNPSQSGTVKTACTGCAAVLGMDARNVEIVKRRHLAIVCDACALEAMAAAEYVVLEHGKTLYAEERASKN